MATVEESELRVFHNTRPEETPCQASEQSSQDLNHQSIAHFGRLWRNAVDDNHQTLFGFQRYRTSHLLNLRFLEAEIHSVDRTIYQAGLNLEYEPPTLDRLGLNDAQKDATAALDPVNRSMVLHLRELLKQYDEAIKSFNHIMTMETFSLSENLPESNARDDLSQYEKYKTRLVRVDLVTRNSSRDPIRHFLRKFLRRLWYHALSARQSAKNPDQEGGCKPPTSHVGAQFNRSFQNTARIAETAARFLIAVFAGSFLVIPLIVLSFQTSKASNLITVSIFIVVFSFLVSILSKASNYETMAASAAYAAVLAVFISGNR